MKEKFPLLLALALAFSLAACGSQTGGSGDSQPPVSTPATTPADTSAPEQSNDTAAADPAPTTTGDGSGILIACFGVPETDGTDTVANASRVATENGAVGNCQLTAQAIQQAVGGGLFAVETVQEYPGTHVCPTIWSFSSCKNPLNWM